MLNVLCNDIKNSGRTEGRKNGRKKSYIEVAAPPKNIYQVWGLSKNTLH